MVVCIPFWCPGALSLPGELSRKVGGDWLPFQVPPLLSVLLVCLGLTHCQLHGVAAALVVCYTTDSTQTSAECAAAFQPILKHPFFRENLVVKVRM